MHQQTIPWLSLFALLALTSSYALNWLARLVAPRLGLVDKPDFQRKLHHRVTPLMGGVAVFVSLSLTLLALSYCHDCIAVGAGTESRRLLALLCSGSIFCLVGLWDDKNPLSPSTKFSWQIIACLPFLVWGQSIESIHLFSVEIPLGRLGMIFVLFWLVSCANVVNLLDGLDGLAGTVTLIVTGTLAMLALTTGNIPMAAVSCVIAASLLGFLLHNWPPAKIFLGDAGSLTIGFLVGAISIEACQKAATVFTLVPPLVALSIPVFDTAMAILRRKLTGKSIGQADRGHIHHRLQARGLSSRQTLLAISALCLVMGAAVVASAYFRNDWIAGVICTLVLSLLVATRIFGHDEMGILVGRIRLAGTQFAHVVGMLRPWAATQASATAPSLSTSAWSEVQRKATAIGPLRLEMTYTDRLPETHPRRLSWATQSTEDDAPPTWNYEYAVAGKNESQVNVSLVGYRDDRPDSQTLDELVRVVQTLTDDWPDTSADVERPVESGPPRILRIPEPRDAILDDAILDNAVLDNAVLDEDTKRRAA